MSKPVASSASSRNMSASGEKLASCLLSQSSSSNSWAALPGMANGKQLHAALVSSTASFNPQTTAAHHLPRPTCDWVCEPWDGQLPSWLPKSALKVRGKQASIRCGAHEHHPQPRVAACKGGRGACGGEAVVAIRCCTAQACAWIVCMREGRGAVSGERTQAVEQAAPCQPWLTSAGRGAASRSRRLCTGGRTESKATTTC